MRIKKLVFSNINNLKGGPHIVSFEEEPLSSAGIFAITGPTGSGKSTLLDVITLALFNKIPRYGKVSKKGIIDQGSVITHHSKSASASVEYEVGGQRFTSTWSVEYARTGNLKEYEMTLMDASGTYIDLNKSQVPEKNAQIIGLNYDQFIKSIILSQGDFARFLKASKNDRAEILEKLTGTDIYRKIGAAAYAREEKAAQVLKHEMDLLKETKLLSEEELLEIKTNKSEGEKEVAQLRETLKSLSLLIQTKSQIKSLEAKLATNSTAEQKMLNGLRAIEEDLKKVSVHDKVSTYSDEIVLYRQAKSVLEDSQKFIVSQKKQQNAAILTLDVLFDEAEALLGYKVNKENFKTETDKFQAEVVALDYQLKMLRDRGGQERNDVATKLSTANIGEELPRDPGAAVRRVQELLDFSKSRFLECGLQEDEDEQILRGWIRKQIDRISSIRAVMDMRAQMLGTESEIKENEVNLLESKQQLSQFQPLTEKQTKILSGLKEKAKLLRKQKEDALKIASLENLRSNLQGGEACPLCGSLEHPYTEHFPILNSNKIEDEISLNEVELSLQEVELKSLESKLSAAITGIKLGEVRQSELANKLESQKSKIKLTSGSDKIIAGKEKEDLKEIEDQVKQKEEGIIAVSRWRNLKEIIGLYEKLGKSTEEYKSVDRARKEKFAGKDVVELVSRLQLEVSKRLNEIDKTKEFIVDREEVAEKSRNALEKLQVQMSDLIHEMGFASVEELANLLLSKTEVNEIRTRAEGLQEEKVRVYSERETLKTQLSQAQALDTAEDVDHVSLDRELQAHEARRDLLNKSLGEIRAILDQNDVKKSELKGRTEKIEKLKEDNKKWSLLKQLIGSKKGDKFASYAQGLTLKNLIAFTNRRLDGLTDRYLLNRPGSDGTLSIIDLYQGNTERAVTTLSGGEIFIISLALALSLSDMASKNIALESLFIDEGFGTLDRDTLDMAMSTLEKLQSESHKTVGVISHVEALKERISTQVQLKKNVQGYSKIEIVS